MREVVSSYRLVSGAQRRERESLPGQGQVIIVIINHSQIWERKRKILVFFPPMYQYIFGQGVRDDRQHNARILLSLPLYLLQNHQTRPSFACVQLDAAK
jgi:hypothetical protein